ncbi:MAG: DUF6702 family protein [Pseudomonadota bacterium]
MNSPFRRLIGLALLLGANLAIAHEQKAAVTTIENNPRTGKVEVIHRFLLHDVEHAARDLGWPSSDLLSNPEDQARFAAYVASRFQVGLRDRGPVSLDLVGQEAEGRYLWVYQEHSGDLKLGSLVVSNTVLRAIWPEQHHLVNVKLVDEVRSLLFTAGTTRLAMD